jgi:predicted RNA-binding Zn-ribbon protein involved in translation (DUF1610 family)
MSTDRIKAAELAAELKDILMSVGQPDAIDLADRLAAMVKASAEPIPNEPLRYNCPIRRGRQWRWRDVRTTAPEGTRCVECGELLPPGGAAISVTCHESGETQTGYRCEMCHKISQDYCAPLGHLRQKVIDRTGMDYVTGDFVDEEVA